eukprot:c15258_g1_i1.p1 GENE.c15258_g1_i1~~c15258_g1_i1.p1  ORF type:complete len:609 (+),score=266.10 c15258_g1_i1:161-1987(+)
MESVQKGNIRKPLPDEKKVMKRLKGKNDDDEPQRAKLPRSSWLPRTPEKFKANATWGMHRGQHDGDDEAESSGYVSQDSMRSQSKKLPNSLTPSPEINFRNKSEKENKKTISNLFGFKTPKPQPINSNPHHLHTASAPEMSGKFPVVNNITNNNNNVNPNQHKAPPRQHSFSSLTRKISKFKISRTISRPKMVRAATSSFKSAKGVALSKLFPKQSHTKNSTKKSMKTSADSTTKKGSLDDGSDRKTVNDENNRQLKKINVNGFDDDEETKKVSTNEPSHVDEAGDYEGDSSINGTDYDYFVNFIAKQPKSSDIFEIETDDITKLFDLGEIIGTGGYSVVRSAIDKTTKQKRAIKIIDISVYKKHKVRMEAEVSVLSVTDHPAIIHLYGVVRTPKEFCLVMELFKGHELFEEIVKKPHGFDEDEACRIITAILEGIDHLHSRGVTHRDVKPENFLVGYGNDRDSSDICVLKLIDFGFATFQNPDGNMTGSSCGTLDYIAPELLLEFPHNQSVDLWSVGVVLYILLCGFPPFFAEDDETVFDLISKGVYDFPSPGWDHVSEDAKHLVTCLLQFEPSDRWTASQALSHSWIVRNSLLNAQKLLNTRLQSK